MKHTLFKRYLLLLTCTVIGLTPADNRTAIIRRPVVLHAKADDSKEYKRMFVFQGRLYTDTGEISTAGRCGVMDGRIRTSVSSRRIPTKELQSNFGTGYDVQIGNRNRMEVCIDDTWHIFAWHENDLDGVSIRVRRSSAKSAVLVIKNTSRQEVFWGDDFLLEKKSFRTGEWHPVPSKANIAFHDVAYLSDRTTAAWKADFRSAYGTLKPGTYRIIKQFGCRTGQTQPEYHTLFAKFRIDP